MQELTHDRLDDGLFIVIASERLDGLDRVPRGRDDELGFTATGSGQHLGLDKAIDRPQVGEDRIWEVLAAVAIDTGLRAVSTPDANDLTCHRRPPDFWHSSSSG